MTTTPSAGKAARLRELGADDAERMNRAITRHRLRPVIDGVVPFNEAPEAFASYGTGTAPGVGKVVIAGPCS